MFVSRGQLGKTALACVTSCMATNQWGGLVALLQGAQTALEGQGEPELEGLAKEMKQVSLMLHNLHVAMCREAGLPQVRVFPLTYILHCCLSLPP